MSQRARREFVLAEARQAAAHRHITGGMVNDKRGDMPSAQRLRRPDAFDIHAGLNNRKVDRVGKQPAAQRPEARSRPQHRKPPAHGRKHRQPVYFDAVGVNFMVRQAGQRAGHHNRPAAVAHRAQRKVPGIPLDPARRGQVLG